MAVGLSGRLPAGQCAAGTQRCATGSAVLPLRTRTQLCGAPLRVSTPPSHRSWLQCSGAVPSHPVAMSAGTAAIGDDAATPAPQTSHALARAAAFAMLMWRAALAKLTAIAASTNQMELDSDAVNEGIKANVRNMRRLAAVMPFAVMSSNSVHTLLLITRAVSSFIKLYLLLLFMRVLLSWFPAFNWEDQPWLALRQVTDPYLNLFRGLVPPLLGTIDFTPLFGFMILQFLAGVLEVHDEDADPW